MRTDHAAILTLAALHLVFSLTVRVAGLDIPVSALEKYYVGWVLGYPLDRQ